MSYIAIAVTLLLSLLLARPAGLYMAQVFNYERTGLDRWFGWLEKPVYAIGGIRKENYNWKQYALAAVLSNAVMMLLVYLIFRFQGALPLNPSGIASMEPTLAFNTVISFMANTNLQHYSGESGLSYLSQMLAIVFMMFTSPATGLAVGIAIIRGLTGKPLGNFFVDMVRAITRILLPICFVLAFVFVALGVPQTLEPTALGHTLEGVTQEIARGPVASFLSIKELGNNGGGFFGVNSAHPFENPDAVSNLLQILLLLLLGTGLPFTYWTVVGTKKRGRVVFCSLVMMFIVFMALCLAC
ncbi:potassium ABC transporter ATPase, partial [Paenibacillus riograndensis]